MPEKEETPPPWSDFLKRIFYEMEKEKAHLKAAWIATCCVLALGCLCGYVIADHLKAATLQAKEATIQTLETASRDKDSIIGRLEKENEKRERLNLELKTKLSEFTAPLKNRTLILAGQLNEFAKQGTANINIAEFQMEYSYRFESWVNKIVLQLDEVGQQSDMLSKASRNAIDINTSSLTNLHIICQELRRLANNLKN